MGRRDTDRSDGMAPPQVPSLQQPPRSATRQAPEDIGLSPSIGRPNPKSGRVKSRLITNGQSGAALDDLEPENERPTHPVSRPVGWLVVIEGPGTGAWYALESGFSRIGRGEDQKIRLNFGDGSISHKTHASIAYEPAEHRFRLGLGHAESIVLVNGAPIQASIDLTHGDLIRIGETTLRLACFCDDRFAWAPIIDKGNRNVFSA